MRTKKERHPIVLHSSSNLILRIPGGHTWHVTCASLLVRDLVMKASDAIGRKTASERRHDIACNGSGIARPASLTSASFGGIAVLLFLGGSISACSRGFGTGADSVQTTLGGGASSTSAKTAPREKILLEGVRFKPDGSGLRPNAQPILDSAVELLASKRKKFL